MPIHYEKNPTHGGTTHEHVVLITIDRPEARNSCDLYHFRDLAKAWRDFRYDDDLWLAIITGVPGNFMTGADLKTYIPQVTKLAQEIGSGEVKEIDGCRLDDGTRAVLRNVKLYKPIIAAIDGPCVAGGMEMLGGIDIRVATPNATFGVMEPARGLFAGGGTTARLPRQLAFPAAMEFLLTADAFPAARALELGLRQRDRRSRRAHGPRLPLGARITQERAAGGAGHQGVGDPRHGRRRSTRRTSSSRRSRRRSSRPRTPRRGRRRSPRSGPRSGRVAEAAKS